LRLRGLTLAVIMACMLGGGLCVLASMGSTIAVGLMLDALIVCSRLMFSIATPLAR
jgi:putative drug exporter of the RND superfamily